MALDWTGIDAFTREKIMPGVADNIFDDNILMKLLKSKGKMESIDGGKVILELLEYGEHTAESFSSRGQFSQTSGNQDIITDAQFDIRHYHVPVTIWEIDEIMNKGEAAIENYLKKIMANASKSLKSKLEEDLFNETVNGTSTSIDGFIQMIDDGASGDTVLGTAADFKSYGSISSDDASWWKANCTDLAGAAPTLEDIKNMLSTCNHGSDTVDVILTTTAVRDYVETLIEPNQRFNDPKLASLGFNELQVKGVPIVALDTIPNFETTEEYMLFLNLDYIKFRYVGKNNFRFDEWIKPTDYAKRTGHIYWSGNLTCTNRSNQGKILGISV